MDCENALRLTLLIMCLVGVYQMLSAVSLEYSLLKTPNPVTKEDPIIEPASGQLPSGARPAKPSGSYRQKRHIGAGKASGFILEEKHLTLGILIVLGLNTIFVFSIFLLMVVMSLAKKPQPGPVVIANDGLINPRSTRVGSLRGLNTRRRRRNPMPRLLEQDNLSSDYQAASATRRELNSNELF